MNMINNLRCAHTFYIILYFLIHSFSTNLAVTDVLNREDGSLKITEKVLRVPNNQLHTYLTCEQDP